MTRKSTKKATSTEAKVKEVKKVEFNISDMVNWTDEECALKDKEFHFSVIEVRDILKSLTGIGQELATVRSNFNLLKSALSKGLMTGYKISCPHCKNEYVVSSSELNRESAITCKKCGKEYRENASISGIAVVSDASIDDKVKDNETVVI